MSALAVISPHLDDAVFSCGALMLAHPGARAITVFAGVPDASAPLPEWDASCGFSSAREAMRARRREDAAALALLGARPLWLDFLDAQYAPAPDPDALASALRDALDHVGAARVAAPLGLFHSDHKLVSRAAFELARGGRREWLFYEDALYRRIPRAVDERLAELTGMRLAPSAAPPLHEKKSAAIACYASQLRGLATPGRPGHEDLAGPERYWRMQLEPDLARPAHV